MPLSISIFTGTHTSSLYLACKNTYLDLDLEPLACESFAAAFAAVDNREADLAIIPIENLLGGRVAGMHYLLPESTLFITNEHFQPVKHCLLGLPGAALRLKTDQTWVEQKHVPLVRLSN